MKVDEIEEFLDGQRKEFLIELFSKLARKLNPDISIEVSFKSATEFQENRSRPKYADREKSDYDSPLQFLTRHYSDLLKNPDLEVTLNRARLSKIDGQLLIALDNWSAGNAERKNEIIEAGLLNKKDFNDLKLFHRIIETGGATQFDRTDPSASQYAHLMSKRRREKNI